MARDIANTDAPRAVNQPPTELSRLFHRLNNQLGIILANAELLETRLTDEPARSRANLVVGGALDAISTIQEIRRAIADRLDTDT